MSSMGMHTLQVCSASRKAEFGCVPRVRKSVRKSVPAEYSGGTTLGDAPRRPVPTKSSRGTIPGVEYPVRPELSSYSTQAG